MRYKTNRCLRLRPDEPLHSVHYFGSRARRHSVATRTPSSKSTWSTAAYNKASANGPKNVVILIAAGISLLLLLIANVPVVATADAAATTDDTLFPVSSSAAVSTPAVVSTPIQESFPKVDQTSNYNAPSGLHVANDSGGVSGGGIGINDYSPTSTVDGGAQQNLNPQQSSTLATLKQRQSITQSKTSSLTTTQSPSSASSLQSPSSSSSLPNESPQQNAEGGSGGNGHATQLTSPRSAMNPNATMFKPPPLRLPSTAPHRPKHYRNEARPQHHQGQRQHLQEHQNPLRPSSFHHTVRPQPRQSPPAHRPQAPAMNHPPFPTLAPHPPHVVHQNQYNIVQPPPMYHQQPQHNLVEIIHHHHHVVHYVCSFRFVSFAFAFIFVWFVKFVPGLRRIFDFPHLFSIFKMFFISKLLLFIA